MVFAEGHRQIVSLLGIITILCTICRTHYEAKKESCSFGKEQIQVELLVYPHLPVPNQFGNPPSHHSQCQILPTFFSVDTSTSSILHLSRGSLMRLWPPLACVAFLTHATSFSPACTAGLLLLSLHLIVHASATSLSTHVIATYLFSILIACCREPYFSFFR